MQIVVTRHAALVELLRERGLIGEDATVLAHVEDAQVLDGQHVFGVLPLSLASRCASVTEIPLALAPTDRGVELDLPRMRQIAGAARTYSVREIPRAVALAFQENAEVNAAFQSHGGPA